MAQRPLPLFLASRPYRERRIKDAACLLPLAGGLLFAMPVVWSGNPFRAGSTAGGGLYLFAIWAGLILAAALFARRLGRMAGAEAPPGPLSDPPGFEEEDG